MKTKAAHFSGKRELNVKQGVM